MLHIHKRMIFMDDIYGCFYTVCDLKFLVGQQREK